MADGDGGFPKVADRWITGLGGLVGVSGILAIVQGRDAIARLEDGVEHQVAGRLYWGLGFALAAIVAAQVSAWGLLDKPTGFAATVRGEAVGQVQAWVRWLLLAGSMVCAVVAVGLVANASHKIWFGAEETRTWVVTLPGTPVAGTPVAGTVLCGRLQTDGALGVVELVPHPTENPAGPVAIADYAKVSEVDDCPDPE